MAKNVVAVRKWGNSRAVCIPNHIRQQLKWRLGDCLYVTVEDDKLIFRPIMLPHEIQAARDAAAVTDGDNAA